HPGDPQRHEQERRERPPLQLLQAGLLQLGVGGGGPHGRWDVRLRARVPSEASLRDEGQAQEEPDQHEPADEEADRFLGGERDGRRHPGATQNGPCGDSWIVSVPRGGPRMISEVSTLTAFPLMRILNRSMPCGAGPSWYSPALLYFEPWHGHSNHCDCWQNGTRHPRWTQRWYRGMSPWEITPSAL